jgi:hypothetical protein
MDTLHEDLFTLMRISRKFFLELDIFQSNFVEKIKRHILSSLTFFR